MIIGVARKQTHQKHKVTCSGYELEVAIQAQTSNDHKEIQHQHLSININNT